MAALPCSGRSNPLLSISREPATKTGRAEGLKFAGSRNARDVLERAPVALSPHVRTMRRMCAAVQCSCGGNHGRGRHRALAYLSRARGGTRCAAERRTHARAPPRLAEACIEQSWRAHHVLVPQSTAARDRATHTDPHTKANVQAHIEAHGLIPELIERAVETLCDMVGWSSRAWRSSRRGSPMP